MGMAANSKSICEISSQQLNEQQDQETESKTRSKLEREANWNQPDTINFREYVPQNPATEPQNVTRSKRRTNDDMESIAQYAHSITANVDEPKTTEEALTGTDQINWRRALDAEHQALWDKQVFQLLRTILAHATMHDLEIAMLDISTAYLNADTDDDIFINIPDGMILDIKRLRLAIRLKKALYGLKQAGRQWNITLNNVLTTELGMTRSAADPCLYYGHINNDQITIEEFQRRLAMRLNHTKGHQDWIPDTIH
eukprot:c19127_g1_i10.p2 GENE.c19127_g1_i10~~c19127_g1_i10.p2  ORF type:complete len:255 (+),score=36.62 c19127_g1_i10:759-1523(+)